jgi:SAM-dependent methyltransferase
MATKKRWRTAQSYELSYWKRSSEAIATGRLPQLDFYAWRAGQMEARLVGLFDDGRKASARILEVGSGPVGIVSALHWGERYAIDSLEEFYKSSPELTEFRNPAVRHLTGTGEALPFPDDHFSLVIIDNVIDHVHAADRVLGEIRRVLIPGGIMYLAVNIHTSWGAFLHRILANLRLDPGHPYTFTRANIRRFIEQCGFTILREDAEDYRIARAADRKSQRSTDRVKGYSGLTEFVYYGVCSKP